MRKRFFQGLSTILLALAATPVLAAEGAVEGRAGFWAALAAGLGITISSAVGAISQSRAISTALEGIARNPAASGKITTPMIIGLAMIESLVIYALVISLLLLGKI